MEEVLILWYWQ